MGFSIERNYKVALGSNLFVNNEHLIVYENTPLFTIKRANDGYLAVDLDIFDANKIRLQQLGETSCTLQQL
jgi:hypothetical protein